MRENDEKSICYDLETNGYRGGILQFCFTGYDATLREQIHFTKYVNPNEELDRYAANIHGISSPNLARMGTFADYTNQITEMIRDLVLIGFNNHTFDDPRLAAGLGLTVQEFNETLQFNLDLRTLCRENDMVVTLENISELSGLQNPMPHDARGDVQTTLRLLHSLVSENKVALSPNIRIPRHQFLTIIQNSVDMGDDSYYITETNPVQMYASLVENGIVQFGPHAGLTMPELRNIDHYLWCRLGGLDT